MSGNIFSNKNLPRLAIAFLLVFYAITNFTHHNWTRDEGPVRGVIKWDIISYYAYLPATFIYGDPSLDFLDKGEIDNDNKFWWSPTEDGRKMIYMSSGLSILYSPFFFMAHALAPAFGEERDGFGSIYQFFLVWGALVYIAIGFIFLRKLLQRFFDPLTTTLTILVVGLGTNLYYYSTHEAVMSHSFNFALITIFMVQMLNWYENSSWGRTIAVGLLAGLITLIRPTNILVLLVFILWGIDSWQALKERVLFFLDKLPKVGLMILVFLLPWIPQFLYWNMLTGQFLFYSYGPHGDRFYFDNPHILESLFSYRKGWLLYTPVMVFSFVGLYHIGRTIKGAALPISLYLLLMIYAMSSWWTWWFGGGFGGRIYIDMYGILSLPLAAFIAWALQHRGFILKRGLALVFVFLIGLQLLQTNHYRKTIIHWDSMSRKAYWHNFLKIKPSWDFLQFLSVPDDELCRKGIYVFYDLEEDWSELNELDEEQGLELMLDVIRESRTLPGEIHRYARRMDLSAEEAELMTAKKMYAERMKHLNSQ